HLAFRDESFPLDVSLDAFNPMVPGDADASGLPVAFLTWTLRNTSDRPQDVLLVAALSNLVGHALSPWSSDPPWEGGQAVNQPLGGPTGVLMRSERDGQRHPAAGTMALATTWPNATIQTRWHEQDWGYSRRPFWYQLLGDVPFEPLP